MNDQTEQHKIYTAIGLMSGTSLDGIDAALIRTDGRGMVQPLSFLTQSYDAPVRDALRACLGLSLDTDGRIAEAEALMTDAHARIIHDLLSLTQMNADQVDMIGFHGQTIFHDPANRFTWQIGDGARLAQKTGITVINDFRSADVAAGGQGAPLIPVYHAALSTGLARPVAILNIGGVANVTFIDDNNDVLAFDVGPGNALVNDWIRRHTGAEYDHDGEYALAGQVDHAVLSGLVQSPFFAVRPPKSLDRDAWTADVVQGLSLQDGAATLSAFTVRGVALALDYLSQKPAAWYVTGGGRLNPAMMDGLRQALGVPVETVDTLGWDGDALEAQGFAYLAVRSHLGLPLSFPTTTGVGEPMCGGKTWRP